MAKTKPARKGTLEANRVNANHERGSTASMSPAVVPPVQLMDLVESFLSDHSFNDAHREFKKQRAQNGWQTPQETTVMQNKDNGKSLVTVFQAWETSLRDFDGAETKLQTAVRKVTSVSSKSDSDSETSSSSSSGEEEDSDVDMNDTKSSRAKPALAVKGDDSANSSESESEGETGKRTTLSKPALLPAASASLKRQRAESEDSSSSSSLSSSDSSSDERPRSKKQKIEESSASDSESDSDSSSASSSDSDSESEVERGAKVSLPKAKRSSDSDSSDSEESSSSSDSESDDEATTPKAASPPLAESDTSVTIGKTSPEFLPVSTFTPLPLAQEKVNNRGKNGPKPEKKQDANAPFSRISKEIKVDPRLASNAFVPHEYGLKAHEDLIVTRGKGFTKEKNKKKRGSYRGGRIDADVRNGIKFDD